MNEKSKFLRFCICLGALAALIIGLILVPVFGFIACGIAGVAGWGVASTLRRHLDDLDYRAQQKNDDVWDVQVNDVIVGSIGDAQVAAIRLHILTDKRLYMAQASNLLRVIVRAIDYLYISIPLAAFWLALGCLLLAPDEMSKTIDVLRHTSLAEVVDWLKGALPVIVLVNIVTFGSGITFGFMRFGFTNKFADEQAERLRRLLGVTTVGSTSLMQRRGDQVIRYVTIN